MPWLLNILIFSTMFIFYVLFLLFLFFCESYVTNPCRKLKLNPCKKMKAFKVFRIMINLESVHKFRSGLPPEVLNRMN